MPAHFSSSFYYYLASGVGRKIFVAGPHAFGIIIGISPFLLQYEFSHLNEPVGLSLHLSLSIGFVFRCFPLSLLLKRVVTPYRHSFKGGWLHTGMVSPSTELSALLFPSK
jgi:hypothetical protein